MSLDATIRTVRGSLELDVDLSIPRGETVVLLGPNGSGKSTLLDVLAGLYPVGRGRVSFDDAIWEDSETGTRLHPSRRGVGLMFQSLALFPHLDVLDNVAYPLRWRHGRVAARRSALAVMETHGIANLSQRSPDELSGGQRQAVALARALTAEPRLLLLDEPLSAFDIDNRARARRHLRSLLDGFSGVRVVVTHDPVEAGALADRVLVLEEGRVVQEGTFPDLVSHPRSPFTAAVVGVNLFFGRIARYGGSTVLHTDDGDIAIAVDTGIDSGALAVVHPHSVAISRERPRGSVRNVLRAAVVDVDVTGGRARVSLAAHPSLAAEITVASLDQMELRSGDEVWASFKATDVDVFPA